MDLLYGFGGDYFRTRMDQLIKEKGPTKNKRDLQLSLVSNEQAMIDAIAGLKDKKFNDSTEIQQYLIEILVSNEDTTLNFKNSIMNETFSKFGIKTDDSKNSSN